MRKGFNTILSSQWKTIYTCKIESGVIKGMQQEKAEKKNRYNCIVWGPLAHQFLNKNVTLPYCMYQTFIRYIFVYIWSLSEKQTQIVLRFSTGASQFKGL